MWFETQPNCFVWGPGGGDPDAIPMQVADISFEELCSGIPARKPRPPLPKAPKSVSTVLRTNEAAAYLGVSPWTLRNLVHDERIPYIPGKYWRFALADLDRFLEKEKVSA